MGQTKKYLMEQEENERNENELKAFFENMLDADELNNIESGIAKLLLDKGFNHLSRKQYEVLDNFIEKFKRNNRCRESIHFDDNLTLDDYIYIRDEGRCSTCNHRIEALERE